MQKKWRYQPLPIAKIKVNEKKQYSTFKVAQSTVMERKDNPVNN